MKLKKKHFKRLQEIAEKLNHELNYSGMSLSYLITDIESVQKIKTETVQEIPINSNPYYTFASGNIFEEQRKAVDDYIRKQGESMVAASTDQSTTFKGGLREAVEALAEPKIGDVGYFWGIPLTFVYYGILIDIITKNGIEYVTSTGTYSNFSKTPPELK